MTRPRPAVILIVGDPPLIPGGCRHAAAASHACYPRSYFLAVPASAATPDKYLLDDTDGVAFLNVRQIVASPLFKKHYLDLVKKAVQGSEVATAQIQGDRPRSAPGHRSLPDRPRREQPPPRAQTGRQSRDRAVLHPARQIRHRQNSGAGGRDRQGFAQAPENSQDRQRASLRIRPGAAGVTSLCRTRPSWWSRRSATR